MKVELEKQRKAAVAAVAKSPIVVQATTPKHMVYCLGDISLAEWKRGQVQTLDGMVQKAGMFVYDAAGNIATSNMATASIGGSSAVQLAAEDVEAWNVSFEFTLVGVDPAAARLEVDDADDDELAGPPPAIQFDENMQIGQAGKLPRDTRILHIVDAQTFIVSAGGARVMLRGLPTYGRVDGQTITSDTVFHNTGTVSSGGTIFLLESEAIVKTKKPAPVNEENKEPSPSP